MDLTIDTNEITDLCVIMGKHGSDKSRLLYGGHHNYTIFYTKLFESIKDNKLRIFELGLGTNNVALPSNMGKDGKPGASLRGWREYFKNAAVFGADIDRDILFEEDRIKTYYCDQLNSAEITNMWNSNADLSEGFDIIIEDGLHTFEANKCFFENSIHKLNKNGFFIIEDIVGSHYMQYQEMISEWRSKYAHLDIKYVMLPGANTHDNNLIVIHKRF